MQLRNFERLANQLKPGHVYRREDLLEYTTAVDRDLAKLTEKGSLEKLAYGLYYKPKKSRYGYLPPDDHELIKAFLKTNFQKLF